MDMLFIQLSFLVAVLVLATLPFSQGDDTRKQTATTNECDIKMRESECDSKIERDRALAIRQEKTACSFEPDWRPTHIRERTLHVKEVNGPTLIIAIDGEHYTLHAGHYCNNACKDLQGCNCLSALLRQRQQTSSPALLVHSWEAPNGLVPHAKEFAQTSWISNRPRTVRKRLRT